MHPIPPHQDTRYVSVSDREAQGSSVTVYHKRPLRELRTIGDYRRSVVQGLMYQMLNARFSEIARAADAPFIAASSGDDTLGRTVEAFAVSARTRDGAIDRGLTAVGQELARVRQHGFGEAELGRAKAGMLARYERAYNERDKSESDGLADELVRHFLVAEAAPGIEMEVDLVKKFLPTITAAETATLAREFITDGNRVVIATRAGEAGRRQGERDGVERRACAPAWPPASTPWKDDDRRPRAAGARADCRRCEVAPRDSGDRRDGADAVERRRGLAEADDFRNDQISFTSYARGGVSTAAAEDYFNASLATALVGLSGIGGLQPGRHGQTARRQAGQRVADRVDLHTRDGRRDDAARSRDRAAAALSPVHGAEPRPGGVQPAEAAPGSAAGESGAEPGRGVQRAGALHQHGRITTPADR